MPAAVGPASRRRCEGIALGAITLDLGPGLGIGPFSIGIPICEAFAQIEHQPSIYDVVHVKYLNEAGLLQHSLQVSYMVFSHAMGSSTIDELIHQSLISDIKVLMLCISGQKNRVSLFC